MTNNKRPCETLRRRGITFVVLAAERTLKGLKTLMGKRIKIVSASELLHKSVTDTALSEDDEYNYLLRHALRTAHAALAYSQLTHFLMDNVEYTEDELLLNSLRQLKIIIDLSTPVEKIMAQKFVEETNSE